VIARLAVGGLLGGVVTGRQREQARREERDADAEAYASCAS
jgi:hypothetical protein